MSRESKEVGPQEAKGFRSREKGKKRIRRNLPVPFGPEGLGPFFTDQNGSLSERPRYLGGFIDFLLEKTSLREVKLAFPTRPETRYVWGDISNYAIINSLKENAYFSHYSAMALHGLTDQIPKTIYLNSEQPKKGEFGANLTQHGIDQAFRRPPRISNNVAVYQDVHVYLLSGKNTGNLGVTEIRDRDGFTVRVTGLERTLIDLAVRPSYSGGVFEVLNAYSKAINKVSVNRLTAILRQINFIYPYHQAIGFYMDKAGYSTSALNMMVKMKMNYDFYLVNQIAEEEYSKKWRLFYPKGL